MTDLTSPALRAYASPAGFDEFLGPDGAPRAHWAHLASVLDALGPDELGHRRLDVDRLLDADGVTYTLIERDETVRWSLDPIPLLISSADWSQVEAGVSQRAVVLDAVLRDLYGPRDLVRRGLIPPEVVFAHPGFLRPLDGLRGDGSHLLSLYAVDLGRGPDGSFHVIADHTQVPSGFGYALANRMALSRVFPSLYRDSQVHRVAPFFRSLRSRLQTLGQATSAEPRIVVLSPGVRSETAYEQAALASSLGFDLVEATDLTVRDGRVNLRALGRLEPVDVILRRVDGAWVDPLELRPDSQLGVPGLVDIMRRGAVQVVNTPGSSVLESPALACFLPAVCRELFGEDLLLPSAPTYWCGDDAQRSHVLTNLETLVVKPLARQPGPTSIFGAELSTAERDRLRRRILEDPFAWVGQEVVELSSAPSYVLGRVRPRRVILRTFAVSRGETFTLLSGGLTRVATDDSMRVTNQAGASSKDTWVLASEPERMSELWLRPGPAVAAGDPGASMSARAAENLFWLGRYLERADATARLLRVVDDRRSDFVNPLQATPEGVEAVALLLQALTRITGTLPGFVGDDATALLADPRAELFALECDVGRTGSLANTVGRLVAASEAVRDQLSVDTWVVVSSLDANLRSLSKASVERRDVVQGTLSLVMQSLLAMHGLIAESMVRDPGWHFLDAGRRIERGVQVSRLLRHLVVDEYESTTASLVYESVLTAGESIITYRRRYRSQAQVETMLDLLVSDHGNPRSLRYQVDRLGEALSVLPGAGLDRLTNAERRALELSTTLRVADTAALSEVVEGTRPELVAFLDRVVGQLHATADAIATANFALQPAPRSFTARGRNVSPPPRS